MCMQTHGGFAFAEEYDVERKFRETQLTKLRQFRAAWCYRSSPNTCSVCRNLIDEHWCSGQPLPRPATQGRPVAGRKGNGHCALFFQGKNRWRDALKPLEGVLVVSMEQAVAAPYCASRLASAGARVIKVERAEGDFARPTIRSSMAKRLLRLVEPWQVADREYQEDGDRELLYSILDQADVFIQNLAPGAAAAGFGRMNCASVTRG